MLKLLSWLFVAGKLGKLWLTGGSMIISVIAYSWLFGWPYAVGFVLLMFFHEMGHYVAARQRGLNVGAPTFIPFVGAWVQLKDLPHDVETEAYIGFAGPITGTLAAIACYWYARTNDSSLVMAIAYSGFMLNLFNLIPISPLDGGRITAIISPKVWLAGVPLLIGMFLYRPSPMLILIAIMAYPQLKMAFSKDAGVSGQPQGYYDVPTNTRINYGVLYLGLVAFLAIMSYELHEQLGAR
ncbi:site-2 protease family protein [Undibacterium sp.]|jgi:Zn-dependent protease|uniref:site-2 protease family protein n=1 Tax=Undibacterium sp. TaxID=1914977 RepID=UPI002BD15981|nr:site-2 protease family protein [Undibacterium sp.]HTD06535.1 site-2 protease family protein [Undibacterium sp.]